MKNKILLLSSFLVFLLFCACSKDKAECKYNSDCDEGYICIKGKCIERSTTTPDTSTSTSTQDTDTQTNTSDTKDTTDTTDTQTQTEPDTECTSDPTRENGQTCNDSCDCYSGHCNNGYCCREGECCQSSKNCSNDLCATPVCTNSMCSYSAVNFACGTIDTSGTQQCSNGNVCDGQRGCIPLVADCGYFSQRGSVDCSGEQAQVTCYTSCTAANAAVNCTQDARCHNGVCVHKDAKENGEDCVENLNCISNHCESGICCQSGECCTTTADCSDQCRNNVACGSNFQCISTFMPCGAADNAGSDLCSGTHRCDGSGSCSEVLTCVEAGSTFTGDGTHSCMGGEVIENCRTSCSAQSHCRTGTQCDFDSGICKAPNGGACAGNQQCLSGRCNNGFCCVSGTCCSQSSDCDTPCSQGNTCLAGVYSCQMTGTLTQCGVQSDECSGDMRCDGHGACVAVQDDCGAAGADSYSCSQGAVVRNCVCQNNDDCDDNGLFCDGTYLCSGNICRYNIRVTPCEPNPCNPDRTCDEQNRTCIDGPNPCDAESTQCDAKLCLIDGNDSYTCESDYYPNGTPCDDELACNGFADRCISGQCVPGPVHIKPCFDNDPCTVDECAEQGESNYSCTNTSVGLGGACTEEFNCYGALGTCQWDAQGSSLSCIQGGPVCNSGQGMCQMSACEELFAQNDFECSFAQNTNINSMSCGDTLTLTSNSFATRSYWDYGINCPSGGASFVGKEALIVVQPDPDEVIEGASLVVESVSPFMNIEFLHLENWCNSQSCVAHQLNGFDGIDLEPLGSSFTFVLDTINSFWPPESVTLRLDCP